MLRCDRIMKRTRQQCAKDLAWDIPLHDEDRVLILYRQRNASVTNRYLRTIAENFSDRFDYTWQYTADPQHLPGAWLVECQADELSSKVDAFCAKPFLYFLTVVITDHSTANLLIPLIPLAMTGDTIIYDIGTRERYKVRNGICIYAGLQF